MKYKIEKYFKILWSFLILNLFPSLLALQGCNDGEIFSNKSIIHGRVTEIAGPSVDSIQFIISATKGLGNVKPLFRVTTDIEGNYEAVINVPKGYTGVEISVAGVDNPAYHLTYRGYETFKEGKQVNDCCSAKAGAKTRYDFRVYK